MKEKRYVDTIIKKQYAPFEHYKGYKRDTMSMYFIAISLVIYILCTIIKIIFL